MTFHNLLPKDLNAIKATIQNAFKNTSDAQISNWLSFSYMETMINQNRGLGIKAMDDNHRITGIIYAQQENPVNGPEGEEKWSIIVLAVLPEYIGLGTGSSLIKELENKLYHRNVRKLFTFTNEQDKETITFYEKNGFSVAGAIRSYQYGEDNNACFLIKFL
jgi:ribosomal protein S18 acetylase RimI-like enzyme